MNKQLITLIKRLNTVVDNIKRMELTPYQFDELVQISNRLNNMYKFNPDEGNHWITYQELADITGIKKYSITIYLSHYSFSRFRMEKPKGQDNKVLICSDFIIKMCEYLYNKKKFDAMKNLKSYYLNGTQDLQN